MKVMALDYGSARTGVAVSDPTGTLARPLGVVERAASEGGLAELARLVARGGGRAHRRRPAADAARDARRAGAPRPSASSRRCAASSTSPSSSTTSASRPTSRSRPPAAAPEDALAAAHLLSTYLEWCAAALVGICAALVAAAAAGCGGLGQRCAADDHDPPAAAVPDRLPRGVHARADGRPRRRRWRRSPSSESHRKVEALGERVRGATAKPRASPGLRQQEAAARGLPLPGHVRLRPQVDVGPARRTNQLAEFASNWSTLNLSYARSKNLTPYDVLTIASMVEGEAQVPSERPLVAAVIYNRLHAHMPLGIDATLRYGLHVPPTQSLTQSRARDNPTPYNTRHARRPAADADQQPGDGVARGGRASRARRLPLLRAQAGPQAPLLHRELPGLPPATRPSTATEVVLLGHPVAHSLSPRMQNAAFAAAGLDWEYVAARRRCRRSSRRRCGEVEYANVTAPYKLDVARILGSELPSVNTIVARRAASRPTPRSSSK